MIWGFHGGDYEECRLLGYKTPVSTSQETHNVSATESNQRHVRCEVFTAVTMKITVFSDIKPQFLPQRRHITSPLQSSASQCSVRFEVFTGVTMKNVLFWDIKTQFLPHKGHSKSLLQSPAGWCYVRYEFFAAVTMKNAVFWDVTSWSFCKNLRFGGT
jgi:hypothetical protein